MTPIRDQAEVIKIDPIIGLTYPFNKYPCMLIYLDMRSNLHKYYYLYKLTLEQAKLTNFTLNLFFYL